MFMYFPSIPFLSINLYLIYLQYSILLFNSLHGTLCLVLSVFVRPESDIKMTVVRSVYIEQ